MSSHRENADEFRRRITDEARLGAPVPAVSTEIARLLGDIYAELMTCVLELELLREVADRARRTAPAINARTLAATYRDRARELELRAEAFRAEGDTALGAELDESAIAYVVAADELDLLPADAKVGACRAG